MFCDPWTESEIGERIGGWSRVHLSSGVDGREREGDRHGQEDDCRRES